MTTPQARSPTRRAFVQESACKYNAPAIGNRQHRMGSKWVLNHCTAVKTRGTAMPSVGFEPGAARQQLERVLESPGFARNERLSRFLRFLVERRLEGRAAELKESVIGVEVFGARPDYDPRRDASCAPRPGGCARG